jgi:hypothetical protein
MWPSATLPLMVVLNAVFLQSVDLHIGVSRSIVIGPSSNAADRAGGQQRQHPLGHPRHPGLHIRPLWIGDPPGQASGGGRAQPRHRHDFLPRHIGALPIQAHQEILPSQLRRSQADQ